MTDADTNYAGHCKKVAVVDAMAEVQSLVKPHWVNTCSDLAIHFNQVLERKYLHNFQETHVVFDRYDVAVSLKTETRRKRLGKRKK